MTATPTLDIRTRAEWRAWLRKHHAAVGAVWLVFHKQHTGTKCLTYDSAVEEALCFGWIDSIVRRLDDERFARKFTPRKPDSVWSAINRRRYADLAARGLLAASGRARAPTARAAAKPARHSGELPRYMEQALKANPKAWACFDGLAPSYRRAYVGWVDSAKRDATRQKRLREAIATLAAGRKLGLK